MISNTVRFLILLLLVNVICGSYATSNDNRRFYQLLKPRSSDNNNEYVWFTRDVHNDININEMKQDLYTPRILLNRVVHVKDEGEDLFTNKPQITLNMAQATKQMILKRNLEPRILLERVSL
ncbi:unnamed protein product [Rotaria sp. Silwood1]|nr:unnamed protein product [Rotaria sp. Silwood1]